MLALLFSLPAIGSTGTGSCTTDIDCSLNGVCTGGACACDQPWGGPGCGVLQYKADQPVVAKSMYSLNATDPRNQLQPCVSKDYTCAALNTWNGPIVDTTELDGKFHMFNPLYRKGSLLATTDMMHGTAAAIEGPYTWKSMGNMGSNPAFVKYKEGGAGPWKFSLWVGGSVHTADAVAGPYVKIGPGPGGNPAPIYHDGVWYATSQGTKEIVSCGKTLGAAWTKVADIPVHLDHGTQEDPFMYIDARGNWHIINHAYDTSEWQNCSKSTLSAHVFSEDGKAWHMLKPNVEPYSHTVRYADGTQHSYSTLERPNFHFNSKGQMTHINLAANMESENDGCPNYNVCPAKREHCACTNCKYADHAGTIIIALAIDE